MAKKTIAALEAQIEKIIQEREHNAQIAQNAIAFANQQLAHLGAIETVVNNSPFANKKFKFFPTLWWVLTNFGALKNFVELVIEQIKTWRGEIDKAIAESTPPPTN